MIHRILALLAKEFAVLWNDRKTRLILVVPPIIQLVVFGFCATMEISNVHLAVLNRDHGLMGREFLQRVEGSPTFTKITYVNSEAALREALDAGEALAAIVIPGDFSRDLARGGNAEIAILLDGRRSNSAQLAGGYLAEIARRFASGARLAPRGEGAEPEAIVRHWYNPNLIYRWFTLPCLVGIITILITTTISCLSVAREKEEGTFEQLLVSPLTPAEIMIAKALPGLILSLAEATLLLVATVFLFDIPMAGRLFPLYAALTIFLLAITGVGLFISSLARTQQQAILGAFLFLAPAILLSGFATPTDNMPAWLQSATLINPIRLFLEIILGIMLKGADLAAIAGKLLLLFLIALATLGAGAWLFRHKLD